LHLSFGRFTILQVLLRRFTNRKLLVSSIVFNIITRKTLLDYCQKYPEATVALQNWYFELLKSEAGNFNDLKKLYGSASLVGDNRMVFNIMGNKYRLVVRIVFEFKAIQIKWFGTHAEYDKIDVATVSYKKK
jgi:mRNA interferase HigB